MKYLYTVQMQKADGSSLIIGVLAQDTVSTPAAVTAVSFGYTQAGAGSALVNCFRCGQVDHDTTV